MSFLPKLKKRIEAKSSSISPDLKEMLGAEISSVLEQEIKDVQSKFAGQLSRIETKLKNELTKSEKLAQFGVVKRKIRTSLAKWLYMSGI